MAMKAKVIDLTNKASGEITLADEVFGLDPRQDVIARVVNWQLAKRRSGNHKTKGISEVQGTTKKPWNQKGTGRARAGTLRSPIFRGGAVTFGPVVRDHGFKLTKKVRALGLRHALSAKQAAGKLIVIDDAKLKDGKTRELIANLGKLGVTSGLVIGGAELDEKFSQAARNIPNFDVLPSQGANVYDIIRRDTLLLTKDAVKALEERLK